MRRNANWTPQDFGINLERADFAQQMCDCFAEAFHGTWTIDEMLLHPRSAIRFCDDVRMKFNYHDLPDDVILRVILAARKNPN